jgi:hypothetical protein
LITDTLVIANETETEDISMDGFDTTSGPHSWSRASTASTSHQTSRSNEIEDPEDANPADALEFDVPKKRFRTKQNVTVEECDTVIEAVENVLQNESIGEPLIIFLVLLKT